MRKVTQADIAKSLGLSPATVALVVGNSSSRLRHCLRKETVERVLKKAREMGYQPNRAAQVMRKGRTNLIVHLNCGGYSELAGLKSYHIGRLTHEAGFDYQVIDSYWWGVEGEKLIGRILSLHPEGLVISGALQAAVDFSPLCKAGVPMVSLGYQIPGAPLVRHDARRAVAELTRHCVEQGRSPVLLLRKGRSRKMEMAWPIRERRLGFLDVLAETGVDDPEEADLKDITKESSRCRILYDTFTLSPFALFAPGMCAASRMIEARCLPDALICTNDHYACGAMTALLKAGVGIPGETAITGYDNLAFTTQGAVSLTTVEQPVEAMCEAAVEILKARIGQPGDASGAKESEEIVLPCRVVFRESTGSVPDSLPFLSSDTPTQTQTQTQ